MQMENSKQIEKYVRRKITPVKTVLLQIILLFWTLWIASPALADNRDNKDSIAIVIGNENYSDAIDVEYAVNDAVSMKAFIIQKLGFREGNVQLLKNATVGKLNQWFGDEKNPKGQLWDWVRKGKSNVFIFYSGHGAPDLQTKKSYIIPTDVNPERAARGYSLELLQKNLELIKKKIGPDHYVVLMLDACFSGVSGGGAIQKTSSGAYVPIIPKVSNTITRLSASAAQQVANWDQKSKHGLLTSLFLKGITGQADRDSFGNGDGMVSWNEIGKYLKSEVSYQARRNFGRDQTPEINGMTSVSWSVKTGPLKSSPKTEKIAALRRTSNSINEEKAFEIAQRVGTCAAYNIFVGKFPNGYYADIARAACQKQKTRRTLPRQPSPRNDTTTAQNQAREFAQIEQRIIAFIKQKYLQTDSPVIRISSNNYVSTVNYYGKRTPRSQVIKDKRRYFRRWRTARYVLDENEVNISKGQTANTYVVQFNYDFSLENSKKNIDGRGASYLTLYITPTDIRIKSERGKVLEKW